MPVLYEEAVRQYGEALVRLKDSAREISESGLWNGELVENLSDALAVYDSAKRALDKTIKGGVQ